MKYEAHLIPNRPTTVHAAPLRWDGEKFREGYGFDAQSFDAPEQAEDILNCEAADAKGFIPTVAEIADAENEVIFDYAGMNRGWTVVRAGEDEKGAYEEWIGEFFPSYNEAEAAAKGWK